VRATFVPLGITLRLFMRGVGYSNVMCICRFPRGGGGGGGGGGGIIL
jgi:hypothetical protein